MKIPRITYWIACLLIFATFTLALASEIQYTDVPQSHWAYKAIQALSAAGIIQGYPDGSFKPDQKITREQFAIELALTLKIPLDDQAPQIFSDVPPNHRSFLYIDAVKSFVPTPADPTGKFNFNGDRPITREEVAESVGLALNMASGEKPGDKYLSGRFKDYQKISPDYRSNIALMAYYGLLSGDSEGNFNPKAGLTRAELAVVMTNIMQKKAAMEEALKPPHKPWTIEFVDFERPDKDMVKDFPDYNKIQNYNGTVYSKVYGFRNSHLVVGNRVIVETSTESSIEEKTVNIYVYEKDLDLFMKGDVISFKYDRNNNITSYDFVSKKQR